MPTPRGRRPILLRVGGSGLTMRVKRKMTEQSLASWDEAEVRQDTVREGRAERRVLVHYGHLCAVIVAILQDQSA
jgi:hypothetical protein